MDDLQKKFGKAVNSSSDHTVQILNESNIGFKQIKGKIKEILNPREVYFFTISGVIAILFSIFWFW